MLLIQNLINYMCGISYVSYNSQQHIVNVASNNSRFHLQRTVLISALSIISYLKIIHPCMPACTYMCTCKQLFTYSWKSRCLLQDKKRLPIIIIFLCPILHSPRNKIFWKTLEEVVTILCTMCMRIIIIAHLQIQFPRRC